MAGGTAVIKDYATCPFRALSLHRFGAERIRTPRTGLNAMERGTLLHYVLAQAWGQLKTKRGLDCISEKDLEAILVHAAADAMGRIRRQRPGLTSGRFSEIEQARLIRLALGWLKEDRKRRNFTVVAIEAKRKVAIGGLTLTTRLDRVDELDDGRRIIIDYKSKAPSVTTMLGDRPEEPQLPLYLVTAEPNAVAVAFAQVKAGNMRFTAVTRDNDLLPGGKALSESRYGDWYGSWEDLVAEWRINLERIVADFMSGSAKIDPRKYPDACRNCDAKPFCRGARAHSERRNKQGRRRLTHELPLPDMQAAKTWYATTPDLDERLRVLDPNGSFIVQAPAGSGKTGLLIQRYLKLLACVNAPEEIVAITFTRKAAAEMRERLMKALIQAASTSLTPGIAETGYEKTSAQTATAALRRDIEASWHILENPSRLRIQTFDSLCAWLTRQMPVLSGFGSQPETMEDAASLYLEAAGASFVLSRARMTWRKMPGACLSILTTTSSGLNAFSSECWRAGTTGCAIFTARSGRSSKQH